MDDNEPLTVRGLAALVVAALLDLAAVAELDLPAGLQAAVIGVVGAGVLVYLVVTGRVKVTPVARPRDADGARLVRADGRALKRAK